MFKLSVSIDKETYNNWVEKCGHRPVIGSTDLFEKTRRATIASGEPNFFNKPNEYFCTFKEAGESSYQPNQYFTKKDLLNAGYTPDASDLEYINKYRDANNQIIF